MDRQGQGNDPNPLRRRYGDRGKEVQQLKPVNQTILKSILVTALTLMSVHSLPAQSKSPSINFEEAGITENLGAQIPLNIQLTRSDGVTVNTRDLFSDGKPVVLVMAYYSCPMLCNLVVESVAKVVNDSKWMPGDKYRIVTISFDPKDTTSSARAFCKKHTSSITKQTLDSTDWQFLIGSAADVKSIGNTIGFRYKYIPENQDFAHGAGIMILTPDGKVSRYLYGVDYNQRDFKLAILEASDRKLVSTIDKVTLYCFSYDSHTRGYAIVARNIMKIGGLITICALGLIIFGLNIKTKDRRKNHAK